MKCASVVAPARAVLVAALLIVLGTSAVSGAVEKRLLNVQVLHRHGARSGQPSYNQSLICTESPCGYLSEAGILMLQRVGAALRERYNNDSTVVDAPMFLSESYNLSVSYSRSTDVLRTLQSAESFLRGFFPNISALYPAIHTQPEDFDWLLSSSAIPWLKYFYSYNKPLLRAVGNVPTDELYPDWTELTRIGATIYSEGKCSDYATRSDCARNLFDYAAAKTAAGQIDAYPLLQENYEKLQNITRVVFDYEYHYNKSEELHFRQGGRGQPFVQEVLSNIDNTIAGTNTYKLMHYSAHDTTLAPIWGTLGDRTDNGMLPPFAQVLVVELLQDVSDGAYHVRVLRGHPGQSPDTDFAFAWDDTWQLRCVRADDAMYEAENNTCPLADFRRLVRWSEPGDARGLCYLDADFVKIQDCTSDTVTVGSAGPALSAPCQFYRQHCPEYSCSNGCVLNGVSLQCTCKGFRYDDDTDGNDDDTAQSSSSSSGGGGGGDKTPEVVYVNHDVGVSGGAAAGIAIATFCIGAIIAAIVTVVACLLRHRAKETELLLAAERSGAREMQ